MIRLNQTASQLLSLITGQNGATVDVSYSDKSSSDFAGDSVLTSITSATTTTICGTPAAGVIRYIDLINIRNTFAGSHTVTVQISSSATLYPLVTVTLSNGDTLGYTHADGFYTIDNTGSRHIVMTSSQIAIAASKTFTVSNTLTLAGTDGTTMTFPATSDTVAGLGANNTFTGTDTFNNPVSVGAATAAGHAVRSSQVSVDNTTFPLYSVGTWTPAITSGGGGTATYTNQYGYYTKVGRQVTVTFQISLASKGTLGAGNISISGLPVAATALTGFEATCPIYYNTLATSSSNLIGMLGASGSSFAIFGSSPGISLFSYAVSDLAATTILSGSFTYFAAS